MGVMMVVLALAPGDMNTLMQGAPPVENPYSVQWTFLAAIRTALSVWMPIARSLAAILSIASFIVRFRRAEGQTRQQFKWFATYLSSVVVFYMGFEIYGTLLNQQIFLH
jgi:hypothetical protein